MSRVLPVSLAACLLAAVFAAPAAAHNRSPVVGYWPLNEMRGQVAYDWSGNRNHGELGSTAGVDDNDPSWIRGRIFGGLNFDGNDFVRIPSSPELEPAEMTVAAFFRGTASPGKFKYLVSKGATDCWTGSFGLYTGNSGGIGFYISDGETWTNSPEVASDIWDGRWHFAAGTFDGETVRLFIDGVQVGSGTPSDLELGYDLATSDDGYMGQYGGTCDLRMTGDLDEVQIWRRALPIDEIWQRLRALGIRL
jgi:Concanavalin A-like lectin/glucanases superfamily